MTGPTDFTEANALLALAEGNLASARRLVTTAMLPGERSRLGVHAQALADLCEQVTREYNAARSTCSAVRSCTELSVGYFYQGRNRRHPDGVCARHCEGVVAEGLTVYEMPEVKL